MSYRGAVVGAAKSSEIVREQAIFDAAAEHRSRAKRTAEASADAAANGAAAAHLRKHGKGRRDSLGGDDDAVAFGRTDDVKGSTLYVGLHLITDDRSKVVVINWQAPAAQPFYQASLADPHGLTLKRTFQCTGNFIEDFSDVLFAAPGAVFDGLDIELLRELTRRRTGSMRDIVATIQSAQYDLLNAPMDQILVIEGGPGTGKTVIALHRVSYLLANTSNGMTANDVLIVGPHPTFTRYIGTVLPSLGNEGVVQKDIAQLAPPVRRGRLEAAEVSRLKGDARMAGMLSRALEARVGRPEPAERLQIDGRFVTIPGADIAGAIAASRTARLPYAQRRTLLRDRIVQLVIERGLNPPQTRLESINNLVERLWPQLTAAAFLRDLLGSRDRLIAAAGDAFTDAEATSLRRRAADRISEQTWTRDDLPLLDEAEHLINGVSERYRHIVVDEAQDLSPMQLRSIARRSADGSMTLAGDLAQSTGPWARDNWDEVVADLPKQHPHTRVSLRYGYRVPRQIYDFAARLLPVASPSTVAPDAVRMGPANPGIHRVDQPERGVRVVDLAMGHAQHNRFVGIVCPSSCRSEVEAALAANGVTWSSADRGELGDAINLVSPHEAKGLEFDAVIVVEPEEIIADDVRGLRLLYVALTRTTTYADVVCVGDPLPLHVAPADRIVPGKRSATAVPGMATTTAIADEIAGLIRALPAAEWVNVLRDVARRLDES